MKDAVYSQNQLKALLSPIFFAHNVRRAILFGSYGKGVAVSNSDVDILVDSGLRGLAFVGLLEEISSAIDKQVDLLDVTHIKKNSTVDKEISDTGILLYEK